MMKLTLTKITTVEEDDDELARQVPGWERRRENLLMEKRNLVVNINCSSM